jgi:large subunit ribosomal protein L15
MKFNELNVISTRKSTRVGRGISAGKGKTAGRGTKGQKARAGSGKKEGFEGGQTPLMMRLPKLRGFKSHRPKAEVVYTSQLASVKGDITNSSLHEAGLVSSAYSNVKLIVKGDVSTAHKVSLQGASEKAVAMVQKAGGSFVKVNKPQRTSTKKSDK